MLIVAIVMDGNRVGCYAIDSCGVYSDGAVKCY